jgi:autotransporter-associated beta strand protein
VRKTGSGTIEFAAANTYSGMTKVTGVLRLSHAQALPGGIGATGGTSQLVLGYDGTNYNGVIELAAGDFLRGLGTGPDQVSFDPSGGGGFSAVGADRIVNLGGLSAPLTWGSGNFVNTSRSLVLGSSDGTSTVDFQNPINLGSAMRTIQVGHGAATVDAMLSGVLSGTVGLTKAGSGVLALTAANVYTGSTSISAGKLLVTGSLADTAVSVNERASLGGTGSIAGKVTVAGGDAATWGTLDLADGLAAALTLSDPNPAHTVLTLGGASAGRPSALKFEVGTTADCILITSGKLAVNRGGALIKITPLDDFGPGVYDLIEFPAGQAGGLANLTLATTTLPGGYTLSLQSTPTAEQLVVTPEPSTFALLAAGALGLVGYGWRRRWIARKTARQTTFDQQDTPAILPFPSHSSPANAVRRAA